MTSPPIGRSSVCGPGPDHSGFALAGALLAIVLIGVLITATMFATSQETRATSAQVIDMQVASYAERAALLTLSGWECAQCDSLRMGQAVTATRTADPPLESTVSITRLDSALFVVSAEATATRWNAPPVRRRISITVQTSRDSSGVSRAFMIPGHPWAAMYSM